VKVILAGQKHFGRAVADLISRRPGWIITAVCAPVHGHPESGVKLDALHIFALNHRLPLIPAGSIDAAAVDRVAPEGLDLIITAHSHDFIGRKTRMRARIGCLGYHPSLLPLYRGRAAVEWQIKLGERVTGGTVYWLNDTVDGGPIAAQRHALVPRGATAASLWREVLQPLGIDLLREVFDQLDAGLRPRQPQDHAQATWFPSLTGHPPLRRPDLHLLPAPGQVFIADAA
jgi:methionyl-tRNA formyltransferase